MVIIGVDYHPSFQQIAFCDQDTGECGERRLSHSNGEAERFYRDLKQPGIRVRVGMETSLHSSVDAQAQEHCQGSAGTKAGDSVVLDVAAWL